MINQLRIYRVPLRNRGPFLDRFRDHAARLMSNYGFSIQAMWTEESLTELKFVYLLTWKNEAEMESCWEDFMSDQEWKDIKAETAAKNGDYVLGIEEMILRPTSFSSVIGEPK